MNTSGNIIDDFRGKYSFLSNFYRCDIEFPAFAGRDLKFNSSEGGISGYEMCKFISYDAVYWIH